VQGWKKPRFFKNFFWKLSFHFAEFHQLGLGYRSGEGT